VRVGSVEVADDVGRGFHAPIRSLTEGAGPVAVADRGCQARERIEREDLDRGIVRLSGLAEDRHQTLLGV
jgi:hypothetical protein